MNEIHPGVIKELADHPRRGRGGLSKDCTLHPILIMAITAEGQEHPCDRCNIDRNICKGFPRLKA
jgi:hypothetical protein